MKRLDPRNLLVLVVIYLICWCMIFVNF